MVRADDEGAIRRQVLEARDPDTAERQPHHPDEHEHQGRGDRTRSSNPPNTGSVTGGRSRNITRPRLVGGAALKAGDALPGRTRRLDQLATVRISLRDALRHLDAESLLQLGQQLDALHRVEAKVELEVRVRTQPRTFLAQRSQDRHQRLRMRGSASHAWSAGSSSAPSPGAAAAWRSRTRFSISCRLIFCVVVRGSGSNQMS